MQMEYFYIAAKAWKNTFATKIQLYRHRKVVEICNTYPYRKQSKSNQKAIRKRCKCMLFNAILLY